MPPHTHSGFFSGKLSPPLLYPPSSSPSCRAPPSSAQLAVLATAAANSLEPDLHSGAGERQREGGGTRRPPKSKLGGEDWAEGPPGARLGPAGGGEGQGEGVGGGSRGQRSGPDIDSSIAPSLGSCPSPHFPPPIARSSIFFRPLILTPGVVLLPRLRIIASSHPPTQELSPPAPGSGGCFARAGFSRGSLGWGAVSKGFRSRKDAYHP